MTAYRGGGAVPLCSLMAKTLVSRSSAATSAMFAGKTDIQMAAGMRPGTELPPQLIVIFIADSVINWLTPCF